MKRLFMLAACVVSLGLASTSEAHWRGGYYGGYGGGYGGYGYRPGVSISFGVGRPSYGSYYSSYRGGYYGSSLYNRGYYSNYGSSYGYAPVQVYSAPVYIVPSYGGYYGGGCRY